MIISRICHTVAAITLLLATTILTTCGDDGSSPKEELGVFGEMAETLGQAEHEFLDANAEISASVQVMEPHIAAVFGLNSLSAGHFAPMQNSCLPEDVQGKLFEFDGSAYVADADTMIDEFTTEFLLYELSNEGTPIRDSIIGRLGLSCLDHLQPMAEIRIYYGSFLVASTSFAPSTGHVSGWFRTPDGSELMSYEGMWNYHVAPAQLTLTFDLDWENLEATYSHYYLDRSSSSVVDLTIHKDNTDLGTEFEATMIMEEMPAVDNGYALFFEEGSGGPAQHAACIRSGTIEIPVFSTPSTECFDTQIARMSVTPAQLESMSSACQSLHAFWLASSGHVEALRAIFAASES